MSDSIVSHAAPIAMNVLKAKREKLLLARTAPVENSDEKPELLPMPVRSYLQESAENKRKRMIVSQSECKTNNNFLNIKKSNPWKSVDSPKENERITTFALPSRASRRLCEKDNKKKKEVKFGGVHVYYFGRSQSYSTVPTSEGASLGMEDKHHSSKNYSFYEFSRASVRQNEQKWSVLRKYLQQQTKPRRSPRKNVALKPALSHTVENEISKTVKEVLESLIKKVVDAQQSNISEDVDMSDSELIIVAAESDSDDENEVLPIPEAEILQPLDKHIRHAILEQSNVPLDLTDDNDCQEIRQSRTKCGCSCKNGLCLPESCECAINGIKCQVDLDGFPCICKQDQCSNPEGRVEFNPLRVQSHYLSILKILKDSEKMNYEHNSFHPRHIKFADEYIDECGTSSYLNTPSPPVASYQRETTTVQLTTDLMVNATNAAVASSTTTTTTVNTSTSNITIAQFVNNNNNNDKDENNRFSTQNEIIKTSLMETPPPQQQHPIIINQENPIMPPPKRKYPVTPTYKRENVAALVYDFQQPEEFSSETAALFPSSPSLMGSSSTITTLRRSPRNSPMKRPFPLSQPPPLISSSSLTSIVVVGNVETTPSPKRAKKVPSTRSIIVNFSQTIDEENFPFEALEQPESSKYEGNGL